MTDLLQTLKKLTQADQVSATQLNRPMTIDFYEQWISDQMYGSMTYLKDHLPLKKNPQLIQPELKSSLILTFAYFPAPHPLPHKIPARVALYAQNEDYHFWIKNRLTQAIDELLKTFPDETFLPFVDSGPILERDLAYRAGLGWFGKNTCLIHPKKGSLFFISEILTSLNTESLLNTSELGVTPDFCGKCTRCIDICPTQALESPRKLNANRCISFLTIESKTVPPVELRHQMNDWFFGCDLCQTVCPWNQKIIKSETDPFLLTSKFESSKTSSEQIEYFRTILSSSNKKIQKMTLGTPLFRSGGFGLKRNALIVIGNKEIKSLLSEVQNLKNDPKLGELATWCEQNLTVSE